jgi:P4 family phage/plasmid primase-like protien
MVEEVFRAAPQDDPNEALAKAAAYAKAAATVKPLANGSDVEIAGRIAAELQGVFGQVVYCEGAFVYYNDEKGCWETVIQHQLRQFIHKYDGAVYGQRNTPIRLGKSRIDSIITELGAMLAQPGWFDARRIGINCRNGFIEFDRVGNPGLLRHHPDHRQRHVLPADWNGPAGSFEGSLLARLLRGCFQGDADAEAKIDLLGEVAAAAALGYGPRLLQPKAVVLLGRTAENGKSQILHLIRGMLPPAAVGAVPPSKFGDEKYVVKLAGKLVNTSDELGTSTAISSDTFKHLVTGEPVSARGLYKDAIDFRGVAQHVFACNQLPGFQGGMDRGVIRRLLVIMFNRTIPLEERVEHIAQRIIDEETHLLLSWCVAGASRLLARRSFQTIRSSEVALIEWSQGADVVLAWLSERVVKGMGFGLTQMTTKEAYDDFKRWAPDQGFSVGALPAVNTFSQRLRGAGLEYKHSENFRGFVGVRVKKFDEV